MRQVIDQYFANFSAKNITALTDMFADDVVLKDWEIDASGKADVIAANQNIFNALDAIAVDLQEYYEAGNTCICVIAITINGSETLKVVDIITFNSQGKIRRVSAYKQ